jgi:CRISPR-associated protein Cas5d
MKDWCIDVWGDYACFTRPEMKVERVSYDVMTPSSARAILDAILWKPAIRWHITKIEVLNPIKWISVRRNEVAKIVGSPTQTQLDGKNGDAMGIFIEEARQQRAGLFLRDVRYRIHAYFEFLPPAASAREDETEAKYAAMFERRAKNGQCFHRPYLGCREFSCAFRLVEQDDGVLPITYSDDLGWMLYDMDYSDKDNPKPEFFRARLENGVVNTDRRVVEVRS